MKTGKFYLVFHLVQDTIGAGDSFIAGFLFGLSKKTCLTGCVQHGVRSPASNSGNNVGPFRLL